MITAERAAAYRRKAIAAIAAKAHNPADAGIACVSITPHDLLSLLDAAELAAKMLIEDEPCEN